jgi:hypothetical protein
VSTTHPTRSLGSILLAFTPSIPEGHMKALILPLLFALAAPAAFAQETEIFRSTMPDGRIVYGESPFPGAKSVRKVPSGPRSTGMTYVTPEEKAKGAPPPLDTRPGGVSVLKGPEHATPQRAEQGRVQSGTDLPRRSY